MKHNTIFNPHNQTSCVNFTTDFGGISNITITGNLLNGGNYTVYSRSGGNGDPTGVSVTGNQFGGAMSLAWCRRTARSAGAATSPTPPARPSASEHRSRLAISVQLATVIDGQRRYPAGTRTGTRSPRPRGFTECGRHRLAPAAW